MDEDLGKLFTGKQLITLIRHEWLHASKSSVNCMYIPILFRRIQLKPRDADMTLGRNGGLEGSAFGFRPGEPGTIPG